VADDGLKKTVWFAAAVSLVCAILVSSTVILLKKIEAKNRLQERMSQILTAGKIKIGNQDVGKLFKERVTPITIELTTGRVVSGSQEMDLPDLQKTSIKKLSQHPRWSLPVPKKQILAGIKRVPKYMIIYTVKKGEDDAFVILPIHGKGLWSTMYGYLALSAADIRMVSSISFYEHGETPGLGGEIDNPSWQQTWQGKQALDFEGKVTLRVNKGRAAPGSRFQIDGLSGATTTSLGVNDMIKFWLGSDGWQTGYGPYLKKLKEKQTDG
jgi:Na+-transporting NADH:ubiquinone oxidoreductase subunit C